MEIQTKFNVGDEVFVFDGDLVLRRIIVGFQVSRHEGEETIEVDYGLRCRDGKGWKGCVPEGSLHTREEAMKRFEEIQRDQFTRLFAPSMPVLSEEPI